MELVINWLITEPLFHANSNMIYLSNSNKCSFMETGIFWSKFAKLLMFFQKSNASISQISNYLANVISLLFET